MPRRPGRPPLDETDPSVSVHVRVPSRQYDAVYAAARDVRISVPELIRRKLKPRDQTREDDHGDR